MAWRRAPGTLKAYVILTAASYLFVVAIFFFIYQVSPGRLGLRFSLNVIIHVALILGLLRSIKVAWIVAIVWEIWTFLPWLTFPGNAPKGIVALSVVSFAMSVGAFVLLLHPDTRRYFRSSRLEDGATANESA